MARLGRSFPIRQNRLLITAVVSTISGSANLTLPLSLVATGSIQATGTTQATLPLSVVATGSVGITAISGTGLPLSLSASGSVHVDGSLTQEIPFSLAASGTSPAGQISGSFDQELPLLLEATGVVGMEEPPTFSQRRRFFFDGQVIPPLTEIRGDGRNTIVLSSKGRGSFVPVGGELPPVVLPLPPQFLTDPDSIERVVVEGVGSSLLRIQARGRGVWVPVSYGKGFSIVICSSTGDGHEDESEVLEDIMAAIELFELAEIESG